MTDSTTEEQNTEDQGPVRQKVPAQVNGTNVITVKSEGVIFDIIFVISEGAVIPIPPAVPEGKREAINGQREIAKAYQKAVEEATELSEKAEALVSAKSSLTPEAGSEAVLDAQEEMRKTLAKYAGGDASEESGGNEAAQPTTQNTEPTAEAKGNAVAKTPPPLNSETEDFVEVYSMGEEKLLLLPAKTVATARTRVESDDNVYYIDTTTTTENSGGTEEKTTVKRSKKQKINLKDAFKGLRAKPAEGEDETGVLDAEKVKQAWNPIKKQIAMDWKLGEVRSEGQIPSRILAHTLSPTLANFFDEDDYEAVDLFVKKINESATARWRQYDDRRKALVDKLEKCVKPNPDKSIFGASKMVDLSPDEWAKIIREVKDVWWADWELLPRGVEGGTPENEYQEFARDFLLLERPEKEESVTQVATLLAEAPLPPVMWDASVGAQILRYSAGATAKANFDLLETGKLGVEASASVAFNLLEAKAEGSFFLPDSNGASLEFELPVRKREGHWAEVTDGAGNPQRFLPAEPTFAFDKSIMSLKGIYEFGKGLQTWDVVGDAVQNPNFKQGDKQLKIQVAGHTDAVGDRLYNQTLSERRAQSGFGFLANRPAIWFGLFKQGRWGDYEVRLMAATVLCFDKFQLDLDWKNVDSEAELLRQIKAKKTAVATQEPDPDPEPTLQGLDTGQSSFQLPQDLNKQLELKRLNDAEQLLESGSTPQLVSAFQDAFNIDRPAPLILMKGVWSPNEMSGAATLKTLIATYFDKTRSAVERSLPDNAIYFDQVHFHTQETIGLGETQLKVPVGYREERNRRLELIPYAITDQTSEMERSPYNFGHVRMQFSGKVSGEAGVNLNLGAKIDFEVDKNILAAGGVVAGALGQDVTLSGGSSRTMDPAKSVSYEKETTKGAPEENTKARTLAEFNAGAEAKGGAFIGAKAEAGIKAAIEWKPPKDDEKAKQAKAALSASKKINNFLLLGDVGYTVTGMAGAGLEGEFKIGFDRDSMRFQIKVKAQASLGLGCGGAFSFSVSIKHIFDFVKLVHNKLSDNDFHFVDVFENNSDGSQMDVYKLFSAWSFEMLQRGHVLEAGLAYVAGGALESAHKLLERHDEIIDAWDRSHIEADNLGTLLETIHKNPPQLAYCTPETKGRLLYRLLQAKALRMGEQRWSQLKRWGTEPGLRVEELLNFDRYHSIEEAALLVIKKGVLSPRDWQKTLQNMVAIDANGRMVPVSIDEDCLGDKVTRSLESQTEIRTMLLADEDDQKELDKHLQSIGVKK